MGGDPVSGALNFYTTREERPWPEDLVNRLRVVAHRLEAVAWAREVERLGAGEIVLTSMDADGTKDGYDLEITAAVTAARSP